MNYNNLCYKCFFEKPVREKPCPHCGYNYTPNLSTSNCLPPGSFLHNRYIVGIALGVGGFGITYKCLDTKIGAICAIKEYFPTNYAMRVSSSSFVSVSEQNLERYNKIMKRFVEEAELVKSLHHRNIITIHDSFFENNTAYYVMEYCDGIDLRKYTNNFSRKLGYDEGMNLLYQIMNGLEYIHSRGILHRDIAPDNIYVTKNSIVKILDFGSARNEMDQYNRELSVIVKVGYAPIEQYGGRGKQGPFTDIYALGATFYHLFTSKIPLESTQRVAEDSLERFSTLRPDLPDNLKRCIEKSMELMPANRIADIAEMKRILGITDVVVSKRPQDREEVVTEKGGKSEPISKHPPDDIPKFVSNPQQASISMRASAFLLDLLLWGLVYFSILIRATGDSDVILGMSILFPIVFTLINTVLELTTASTAGKALLGLYICGRTTPYVMPSQVLLRNIIKPLSIFGAMFSKNGELIEDKTTDSVVRIKKMR